jgi:hypothetical protein
MSEEIIARVVVAQVATGETTVVAVEEDKRHRRLQGTVKETGIISINNWFG